MSNSRNTKKKPSGKSSQVSASGFSLKTIYKNLNDHQRRVLFSLLAWTLCVAVASTICILSDKSMRKKLTAMVTKKTAEIEATKEVPDTTVATASDAEATVIVSKDLTEEEKMQKYPLLLQKDSRWADEPYGSSTIAVSGCCPTCLSMAVVSITRNYDVTPAVVAKFSEENGYYIPNQGTVYNLISEGCYNYGLKSESIGTDEESMKAALDQGQFLVIGVDPGVFTDTASGHYITVYGYDESGFKINDPNSYENSQRTWKYDEFSADISFIFGLTKE